MVAMNWAGMQDIDNTELDRQLLILPERLREHAQSVFDKRIKD